MVGAYRLRRFALCFMTCGARRIRPTQSRRLQQRKRRAFATPYHPTSTIHVTPPAWPRRRSRRASCLPCTFCHVCFYAVWHMVACFTTSGTRSKSIFLLRCLLRCLHPLRTLPSARPLNNFIFYTVRNIRPCAFAVRAHSVAIRFIIL